jgi:alkyldihydroxyacetonephosphate synthase
MSDVLKALEQTLGSLVRREEEILSAHARDTWSLAELLDYQGQPGATPIAVVEAANTADIASTLRICREHRTPVVAYGGGSGVCGSIRVGEGTVVVSTRGLSGLVEIDNDDLTATFRAGTMGGDAERLVQEHGLTIGHWPQSIEISTVGGWVATRASGQYSTAYGNIEDIILDLEVVLPDGQILRTKRTPRAAAGPDLRQWFLGSEGTLGVITEVTLSLRPLAEHHVRQAFHFDALRGALPTVQKFMREGWRPPVVRLYDPRESHRHFGEACPKGRAMLILLHEGPKAAASTEASAIAEMCRSAGGEVADAGAVDEWFEKRNEVPSFRSLAEGGLVVDTIEVASTWQHLANIYDAVTQSLDEIPGMLSATAHTSHAYRSGANLYFTFVAKPDDPETMADVYRECWDRAMRATLANHGGIAHHHGIGRVRRDYLVEEIGAEGLALLTTLKRALDPDWLLNPGNLLPIPDAQGGS